MSEQQSRLAIVIDSTGAQRNAEGLAGALAKMTQAGQKAADSAGKTAKATEQEAKSLSDLLDRIDPVNAALNRLDEQQRQLAKFQARGFIDTDTFSTYSKKIEDARNRLTGFSETVGRAGISSKQAAYQMRMIPAQMTDIAVSLAGGQSPFMVLLQQGGQLKDMFGGIGPAVRAVGSYASRLINPFTLAAAAGGTLAAALYSAQNQASELNRAANSLTNASGLNLNQFRALAQGASALGVSYGSAIDAVGKLTQSLSNNTSIYPQVIKASNDYAQASGQDLSEVVGMFNQLSANGGKAIEDLDDKFNFLTVAQRKQADEALRSGNIADAQRIAFGGLASKLEELTNKLNQGATGWDKFWRAAGKGVSGGWETIKEIAGGDYFDNADVRKYQERTRLRSQKTEAGTWTSADENYYQMLNKASPAVRDYIQAQKELDQVTQQASGNRYLKNLSEQVSQNADAVTRARNALQALDNEYMNQSATVRAAGQADYSARRVQLEKALKDAEDAQSKNSRAPRGKSYSEDAGTRFLDQLRQQQQVLLSQADTGERIGTQQQALVKWEQQLADIKSKQTLTADQKSLLANAELITAQLQQNAALERQIETREKLLALDKARADISRTIANRQSQYATEELFSSGGMSQYEQQQYTQRLSLEQSYNDKISQLRQQRASATSDIAREEIDQEIQLQRQALQTELSNYDAHISRMNQLRGSFTAGASRAWQEYRDSAANVSGMSERLFTNAFGGMEDALVNFVVTGKASFRDFATSIISDLARIAARQAVVGIGSSIFSAAGSMFGGGTAAAGTANNSFSGGAYNNLTLNAKGGVYDSPSLSSYSGRVYDSPQFFAFAKGAGVFGEAGPEAIMPLARSADGSLGVRMISGGSAGGGINVTAPVTIIQQQGQQSGEVSNTNTANTAKQLEAIVIRTLNGELKKQMAPGGLLYSPSR